jgi:hypothetical protein
MKNPLFPTTIIDYQTIKNYNKCLIITQKNSENSVLSIFDEDVDSSFCESIVNSYNLNEVPMWIVKLIPEYYKKFIIFDITEDNILKFNFARDNIVYNLQNACILIPNHPWNWFEQFIEPYVKDGIKDMYTYIMQCKITNNISDIIFKNKMKNVNTSYDVNYWADLNKCRMNITTPWLLRDINFSDAKEININQQKLMDTKCNDYLSDIINKKKYVDASSGIKTKKYSLYYLEEYPNLPIDIMINKLINCNIPSWTNELIMACLRSKKYCHKILKNDQICSYIGSSFNMYAKSFGYAWLMMYIEEGILKSKITEGERCVFTLEEANKLPIDSHNKNVYIPLLVEKGYINMFGGYQSHANTNITLSTLSRFRERLMIFSNNYRIDLFKNFNWQNIAISGSVIAAASRALDPLEKDGNFTTNEFFNTYYKDSDIDVMCDAPDYPRFIDKITYMVEIFKQNILEKFPLAGNPINVTINKNVAMQLSKKYVEENYKNLDSETMSKKIYDLYLTMKNNEVKQTNTKYMIINEIVSFENFKFYVYDNPDLKEPIYNENIKYNIGSNYLSRKFEVFRIKYNFLATVSRFHLPCVRGYYDGNQVYLLPSAISALLTNKCIDYKYFAGVRSPFEIILKYIFRGYSVFLNKREMIKVVEYIKNSEKWKDIFRYDNKFRVSTFQSYYSNPYVLLNKENISYYDYRKYYEYNLVSPIISSLGYVIPYNNF